MAQYFDEAPSEAARALQIWLILIGRAANRQTMTYGLLADVLGFKGAGVLADMLGHIMYYCRANGLPPLSVLVVNQDTGLPGEGLARQGFDLNADRESVFKFNWFGVVPPTVEELAAAFKARPEQRSVE